VVFCADLIPGAPWVHLPVTMGYDRYPEMLIDEKRAFLDDMRARGVRLYFTHDTLGREEILPLAPSRAERAPTVAAWFRASRQERPRARTHLAAAAIARRARSYEGSSNAIKRRRSRLSGRPGGGW
jgi:glyoxylase-like metal-dependent hydrolase (beta-lactamase superfamily II)